MTTAAAKPFACQGASSFNRVRSGGYVMVSWSSSASYYTYNYYPRSFTGNPPPVAQSGTVYNGQITLYDASQGGTITVTPHCYTGTPGVIETGTPTTFTWQPN